MTKTLICVTCPRGCTLSVECDDTDVKSVSGNFCPRGDKYARNEIVNPVRSIHSTVKVNGGAYPVVPVKTSSPISKTLIFDCMKEINKVTVDAPVKIGQVIIENVLNTGINIVATNNNAKDN